MFRWQWHPLFFALFAASATIAAPAEYDPANLDQLTGEELVLMLPEGIVYFGRPLADRDYWSRVDARRRREVLRQSLLERLADPPDFSRVDRKADGRRWAAKFNRLLRNLDRALLVECLDNRGEFQPAICGMIARILNEPSWIPHAGLAARTLALADWVLGKELPQRLRARIRQEVGRRIFEPYRQALPTARWNGNAVYLVECAALLIESPGERAKYLLPSIRNSGDLDSGSCAEMAEVIRLQTGGRINLQRETGAVIRNAGGLHDLLLRQPSSR